jgi:hypothetical protein
MIIEGMADNLSWPLFNVSYAEQIQRTLGSARANEMMRFYLHDNGRHGVGGGEPGIFQQSMQDLMAWAEKGIAPPPSTRYTIKNGQVVPPDTAAARRGLQPVITLTVNGRARAVVRVNEPVNIGAKVEMPPGTGQIVRYSWSISGLDTPQPSLSISPIAFSAPGTYIVRLTVNGQRDGLSAPANQTLLQNFKEVRVVVQ